MVTRAPFVTGSGATGRLGRALCAVLLGVLAGCGGSPSAPAPVATPTRVADLAGLYHFDFSEQGVFGCRNDHFGHLGWDVTLIQTGTTFTFQFSDSVSGRLLGRVNGNAVSIEFSMSERGDPPHVNEWRGTGSGTLQGQDIIGRWQGTITCPAPSHTQFSCPETNRQFRIRRTFR